MNQQQNLQKEEAAIRILLDKVVAAFNKADLEKLLSYHTDDIILMEPNMPLIKGKAQVRRLFAGFQQKKIEMELGFDLLELEISNHLSFVRGRVVKKVFQNGVESETDTGKFICLLKKQANGEWLRTHVIVNSDQPVSIPDEQIHPATEEQFNQLN